MRLIDANALLNDINERYEFYSALDDAASSFVAATLSYVADAIKDAPTVKLRRTKGRWINNCKCSECGYTEHNWSDAPNNFCPICGADMRGN